MQWNANPMRPGSTRAEAAPAGVQMAPVAARDTPRHVRRMNTVDKPEEWGVWAQEPKRGIPVRECLQALHKIQRDKDFGEAVVFVLFFASFILATLLSFDIHTGFMQTNAVIEHVYAKEFSGSSLQKNFYSLSSVDDFWDWLEGPAMDGLYQHAWYNGDALSEGERGYALRYLRLMGGVQLRQLRVSNDSCSTFIQLFGPRYSTTDGTCYGDFSGSTATTAPFGPPNDPTKYTWSGGLPSVDGLYGFNGVYGTGGYLVYLPENGTEARAVVQQLKQDKWVDRSTRAVIVSFNLYNANTRMLTSTRALVEMFSAGNVLPFYRLHTAVPVMYFTDDLKDSVRIVFEVALFGFWIYYFQREAKRLWHAKPRYSYFLRVRTLFELVILGFMGATIVAWLVYVLDPARVDFDVRAAGYQELYEMARKFDFVWTWSAVVMLACFVKLFKFLALNKRMGALWRTLYTASDDILTFVVGHLVVVLGFAFAAHLLFGAQLREFHNLITAFSTLNRYILGDFDYSRLSWARPQLAGWFFALYVVLVIFTLSNMFVAILIKNYDLVRSIALQDDDWQQPSARMEFDLVQRLLRLWRRRSRAARSTAVSQEEEERDREAAFVAKFRAVSSAARRNKGVDLYEYFRNIYLEAPQKNQFIGLPELCAVLRTEAVCTHHDCDGTELLRLYAAMKDVVLLGGSEHVSSAYSASAMVGRNVYRVTKVNKYGLRQSRLLVVDRESKVIRSFDVARRFRKAVDMRQITQLERSTLCKNRLRVCFKGSQTPFVLIFNDGADRDELCKVIVHSVSTDVSGVVGLSQSADTASAVKPGAVQPVMHGTPAAAGGAADGAAGGTDVQALQHHVQRVEARLEQMTAALQRMEGLLARAARP